MPLSKRSRILIIAPDSTLAHQLEQELEKLGMNQIRISPTYEDGLEQVRTSLKGPRIHYVFLDPQDELEATRVIQTLMSHETSSEVKIIVLRKDEAADIRWAFRLGAIGLLDFPLSGDKLAKVFRDLRLTRIR